jgi:hypothetical protein
MKCLGEMRSDVRVHEIAVSSAWHGLSVFWYNATRIELPESYPKDFQSKLFDFCRDNFVEKMKE